MVNDFHAIVTDTALLMYFASISVSFAGFILFAWWWLQVGKVSEVYGYVTMLLLANLLSDLVACNSRFLYIVDLPSYESFRHSAIWDLRRLPETLIVGLIFIRMFHRVLKTRRAVNGIEERNK
jgi:hypothetical protein